MFYAVIKLIKTKPFSISHCMACWRSGFRIRRQSVASLMAGSIIDLDLKPMCLIKLIDFSF